MTTESGMEDYMGVRFTVEAVPSGDGASFVGRYTLYPSPAAGEAAAAVPPVTGVDDVAHPSMDRRWATENEARNYAAQGAHSAIEILVAGRTQGQGNRSVELDRRMTDY